VDAIDVALTPTEIRADDFQVRAGETLATARFRVAGYASENPMIDASLESRDATLEEIQSITRAYGVGGLDRIEGTGRLNLDMRASGPLDSVRSESVARSLDGNLDVNFTPLRVLGFDAAGKLSSLVGFDDGTPEQDYTEIITLRGNIDIVDGIARTEDLVAQLTIGEVALVGTADLAEETLDLRLAAVMSQAFSDQVRTSGVGRGLETAFTNTAGELVLPVRVTGAFADPRFTPDAEALARMQLERAMDNPSGFLDALLGRGPTASDDGASNVDSPESGTAGAIRGILGGLFGGGSDDDQD
jgi:AsmA protein